MRADIEMTPRLSRRQTLQQLAAAGLGSLTATALRGAAPETQASRPEWHDEAIAYLETLARPDGGYAWGDQPESHLAPTFAVIAAYQVLGRPVPRTAACAEYMRTHHPTEWKKLEQEHREFDFQQLQALHWLGAKDLAAAQFTERVRGWTAPVPYLAQYERHRHPVFRFQLAALACRPLLGLPMEPVAAEFSRYLLSRRRPNGSFNNSPAAEGGDGHVLNTLWGLEGMALLGLEEDHAAATIAWLQGCQAPSGGFRWQPKPAWGMEPDVAYTWGAVTGLARLGARPTDPDAAVRWLLSLRNADGGFGDRPGWASNAVATRYALEALAALDSLQAPPPSLPKRIAAVPTTLPKGLQVFSIQIEAHGSGSPAEAVDLAKSLQIDLWGAKNAKPGWLEAAQSLADRQQVPVRFFTANEEYGTWIDVPGFGTYSHMSDIIAPAGSEIGPALTGDAAAEWNDFRRRRIEPLHAGQGRIVWQFGENEELVRTLLDDALERGGYAAVSTFHFGNPDFTNSEPFLNRYRGHLPFVALQDAHGPEPWWFADMTTGFRTLFLAEAPTWENWLTALRNGWVAAVRRDAVTGDKLRMHAGSDEVARFVLEQEMRWRWWDNPAIARPLVSVVVLKAGDRFETGVPETGVALRIRCAWTNTNQGVPKTALAELKTVTVDGQTVEPEPLETMAARRGPLPADRAHIVRMPSVAAGEHVVRVTVARLADGGEESREIRFTV
ncbi:prenyltransferase/squalene oxidase repeat-containing protein [Planctomyces sp. SH-PL14]|uniref:prenyltransferase/squalene oxidase repeat-containing protein n=1 Tax=Planctomyces sp. SH-PL14 TaxID=1632864 RepID=UPI00078EEB4B|nr:prenyltransferase/squalene oxidase repeat-containing protein [Planctomyces sp. SH-PL14]AMV21922.1 Prenyltransferase and squalene oxidase repeat protein [Planctomyces sp. SH-PL14]